MGKKGDLSAAPGAVSILDGRLRALLGELVEFVKEKT